MPWTFVGPVCLVISLLGGACIAPPPAPGVQPNAPAAAVETDSAGQQQALLAGLISQGPAPELANELWLNSAPLKLADLRGKVVIVEFWTYGCINCRNVTPAVRAWYERYHADGLEIIGVHTPEFAHEHAVENVRQASVDLGVTWPIAIDNEWTTWRAYSNRYWPAMYFIDKTGHIRHIKIGEGQYQRSEQIIQALLAEPG